MRSRCAPPAALSRPRSSPGRIATSRANCAPPMSPPFSDQLLDEKLSPKLPPARLERFAEIVKSDKISTGASALGWRRLKDGNCGYSLGWFRKSIAWSDKSVGDGKLYSGYAQGLRAVGMFNEGEDAAFTWADRSKEARELYTNIVIEELTRTWPRVADERGAHRSLLAACRRGPVGAGRTGARLAALHAGRLRLRRPLVRSRRQLEPRPARRRQAQRRLCADPARRRPPVARGNDRLSLDRAHAGDEEALHRRRRRRAFPRLSRPSRSRKTASPHSQAAFEFDPLAARRAGAWLVSLRARRIPRGGALVRKRARMVAAAKGRRQSEARRSRRRLSGDPRSACAPARGLSANAARLSELFAADRSRRGILRGHRGGSRQDRGRLCPHACGAVALGRRRGARLQMARALAANAASPRRHGRRASFQVRPATGSRPSGWPASSN